MPGSRSLRSGFFVFSQDAASLVTDWACCYGNFCHISIEVIVQSIPAHEFFCRPVTESMIRPAAGRVWGWSRWTGAGLLLASLALQDAWGLALGQARIQSAIGEPLQASIDLPALSAEEAETLQISVANAAAFQAAGLDYKPALSGLVLQVERGGNGQPRLSLRGQQAVNDAYLDLLLQANWKGGQLTRRYSLLLSPASSQPAAYLFRPPYAVPAKPH